MSKENEKVGSVLAKDLTQRDCAALIEDCVVTADGPTVFVRACIAERSAKLLRIGDELLHFAHRAANECDICDGSGTRLAYDHAGNARLKRVCTACAGVRALIAKVSA